LLSESIYPDPKFASKHFCGTKRHIMIPIRDTIESRNYPVVTHTIIGINVVLFLLELAQGPRMDRFLLTYGLVPARYSIPAIAAHFTIGEQITALFSFMFLHGGVWHLVGNMWSLYIFGDNVEDRLGPLRYAVFYLACGWVSGIAHLVFNWHSQVPTIGASGAIAGVMGAYFILYPRARILTLIPVFFIPYFLEIPAFFFLGVWFLLQFLSAAGSQGQGAGIAWWAHIGGFLFGMIGLLMFRRVPSLGVSDRARAFTARTKSPRLQVIRPTGSLNDPNLYGTIGITAREAVAGSRKVVNIPWGFQKRLFTVVVPPGVRPGSTLRLRGMGKDVPGMGSGDLYLQVVLRPDR